MARSVKKYLKISKGQISKNLAERTDIGILDDSGQEITNFYNTKYGALQTVAGTEFMFNFGKDAKVKLHTIHLSDNKEATLAFDATNQKLYLFDYQGNQLDQISFPYITEENYERSNIAQQEELVLLATGDNPLVRIGITNNKLSHSIYTIPAKNVMKVTNVTRPLIKANIYRIRESISSQEDANNKLPQIDSGWAIGTYIQPNQIDETPSNIFPWTVYQKTIDGWVGPIDYTPESSSEILIYTNNTPGSFNFNIPSDYTQVQIEYAGASGGRAWANGSFQGSAGQGSICKTDLITVANREINGIIGQKPPQNTTNITVLQAGGSGYNNGSNATRNDGSPEFPITAGGGGGSTGFQINGTSYEACGGGGAGAGTSGGYSWTSGKGGGDFGGAATTNTDGNNATDQNAIGFNADDGYINIYAITGSEQNTIVTRNNWDDKTFSYKDSLWIDTSPYGDLDYPNSKFAVSATAGIVNITPVSGNLATITVPNGLEIESYAKSILIGTNFDSESAIGVVRITEIEGNARENVYNITKISGPTIVGFDKVYTSSAPATGFKITTSMTPALSGALPSTNDNPTSDTNYPNLITFYQQRLVIFGTQYNQEQVLVSNIGEYDNFTDDYLSTSAFQLVLGSKKKESIRAFCINQGIQLFTNVGEWIMDTTSITRTSGFVQNSTIGTNGVQPIISANGITLFCPKNGKGIVGFIYNDNQRAFGTPYISQYTDLLNTEVKDLFLKSGQDSTDDTLLYICDIDGNLIVGNYLQDHNIQGFCRRSATGVKFLQTVQNEENVLLLSSRAGYTTLERIDQTKNTAHSTRLFQYNQESGVITLELPQYRNTLLNVYDETGEFVDSYTVSPEKELYEWYDSRLRLRANKAEIDSWVWGDNVYVYDNEKIVGRVYVISTDDIQWNKKMYLWTSGSGASITPLYTYSDTPSVGDYVYTTQATGSIVEVGEGYIKALIGSNEFTALRAEAGDGYPQFDDNTFIQPKDTISTITVSTIEIPEGKRPQAISEIGYNIHQVFHSNPMNIGGITMSEYKSIARIDIALTSESRHDALTINKKYGRRKGNLVSYVRPQRPTRDCTFTIENDIYPVEILSMEVEIEY